jgi:hypothetical protein
MYVAAPSPLCRTRRRNDKVNDKVNDKESASTLPPPAGKPVPPAGNHEPSTISSHSSLSYCLIPSSRYPVSRGEKRVTETDKMNRAGWHSPLATLVTTDRHLVVSLLQSRYPDADAARLVYPSSRQVSLSYA